jgi:hypothetical protein
MGFENSTLFFLFLLKYTVVPLSNKAQSHQRSPLYGRDGLISGGLLYWTSYPLFVSTNRYRHIKIMKAIMYNETEFLKCK